MKNMGLLTTIGNFLSSQLKFFPVFIFLLIIGTFCSCSFFSRGVVYRNQVLSKDLTGPKKPWQKTVEIFDGEKRILIDAPPEGYIVKRVAILPALYQLNDLSGKVNNQQNEAQSEKKIPGLAEYYTRKLIENLSQTRFYNILSEKDLNLQTLDYLTENAPDIKKMVRLGKTHDVWGFIIPIINQVEIKKDGSEIGLVRKQDLVAQITASIQVFDVQARKKIFERKMSQQSVESVTNFAILSSPRNQNVTPRAYKAIQEIAINFVPELTQLTAKIGWKATLASIELDRIFINAGRNSGLRLGDILQVSEPGADVIDSDSNRLLGEAPGRVKGTLEVINFFGDDGAIGRLQSGAGFMVGDIVELY